MTTTTAAERVAALRDEYARLGENVDHLTDLDLLNEYAERAERDRINTNDRYMRLLTEQRHYGDRVRQAAVREMTDRVDQVAAHAVQRRASHLDRIFSAVDVLPERANAERVQALKRIVADTRHSLSLYEGADPAKEWRPDDNAALVHAARGVVGVLRGKPAVSAEDVIRLVGEALTPNGNLRDLFDVAHATPIKRQQPVFVDDNWAEMGGGSYWAFEPAGSRYRVVAYSQGDTWWIDLQGPTGALIAAGEATEGEVAATAAALVEQAPDLAASGLRPWQCWKRVTATTTTSAATAA
ncbi:hypothetical protein [Streptomyces rubrogriseus]|uniref:hypothetical protein n=1 Tax=Streptomyces rubrogriseus TaxID=194673 RepID=UPI000D59F5FF|nr:hypothetical protein [Streptomyces rubrogriseus]